MLRSMSYMRNNIWKVYSFPFSKTKASCFTRTLFYAVSNNLNYQSVDNSSSLCFNKSQYVIQVQRNYSKKKKSKKSVVEDEDESDDDEEKLESFEDDEVGDGFNVVTRTTPSMRIDAVAKAAYGVSKKKFEKEFYASNVRVNGVTVLKKATNIGEGDELDIVKDYSPENDRLIIVDRLAIKAIGKPLESGFYPLKLQVFKGLTIENYPENPWVKTKLDPD